MASLGKFKTTKNNVQVAGVIRFSFPCLRGFRTRYENKEAHLADLFSEFRMESRFATFENLCLHTLKRQTNKHFKIGIIIGQDMPEMYRERLFTAIKGFPQAQVFDYPIMDHNMAIKQAFNQLFDPDIKYKIGFRLDDDDAVAINYIDTRFELAPKLIALSNGEFPIAAPITKGFSVFGSGAGQSIVPAVIPMPPSVGMSIFSKTSWNKTVYRFPHKSIGKHLATYARPDQYMYIRTIHQTNIATHPVPKYSIDLPDSEIDSVLRSQFKLSLAELRKI